MTIFNFQFSIFKKLKAKSRKLKAIGGFSLLETIVATAIILIGLIGVIILMGQATRSVRVTSSRIIASHLAQEAVEVIINIRDTNWLEEENWRTGLPATTQGIVNHSSKSIITPGSPYCLSLINDIYFDQLPPCNTAFRRHVEIINKNENIGGSSVDFIEVKGIVEWSQGGVDRSVVVVNHLYDWR